MTDKIKHLIEINNLTPSRFADEIGIQRSAISHILSGRNKPSLDVVQKILLRFPDVSADWLLSGREEGVKPTVESIPGVIAPSEKTKMVEKEATMKKLVDKIVVFYTDHTFEEFQKAE